MLRTLVQRALTRCTSLPRPRPGSVQTARGRARHTNKIGSTPARPRGLEAHHSDAWCRRSSNRFRQTTGCRAGGQAEPPAMAWLAENEPDRRAAAAKFRELAPAELRLGVAPLRSR